MADLINIVDAAMTASDMVKGPCDCHSSNVASKKLNTATSLQQKNPLHLLPKPDPKLEWASGFGTNCICGKKFSRKTIDNGAFNCPICRREEQYVMKHLYLKCHWWYIPLCTSKDLGTYIKCKRCENHFDSGVLEVPSYPKLTPGKGNTTLANIVWAGQQVKPLTQQQQQNPSAELPVWEKEIDIVGSVIDYSSFDYSKEGVLLPDFLNAEDILRNAGKNGVLGEVISGFGSLATQLFPETGVGLLSVIKPVEVTNIASPDGLVYAPKDAYCLNFMFHVKADESIWSKEAMTAFYCELESAINIEGKLYDIVKAANPETLITGLGKPGKGIDYNSPSESKEYTC